MEPEKRWKYTTLTTGTLLLLSLLLLPACCCTRGPDQRPQVPHLDIPPPAVGHQEFDIPDEAVPADATSTEMRNVHFWLASDLVLNIRNLRGQMRAKETGQPLNFDDKTSFIVDIHTGEVGISESNLQTLMNRYVFSGSESPLRNLSISIRDGIIHQEGTLHKIIDIPFQMDARVELTDDGRIRLRPESIEICGLPGGPLMRAFGMSLEEVMDLEGIEGVTVEGNDLIIDPLSILPPPTMRGRITEVRIENDQLVQVFSSDDPWEPLHSPVEQPNYMFFRHGTLRMGKLLMVRADMHVVDSDPSDPFEFYLDVYNRQLVAGFTQNLADYGLLVIMRDINDLDKPVLPGELICRERPCEQLRD